MSRAGPGADARDGLQQRLLDPRGGDAERAEPLRVGAQRLRLGGGLGVLCLAALGEADQAGRDRHHEEHDGAARRPRRRRLARCSARRSYSACSAPTSTNARSTALSCTRPASATSTAAARRAPRSRSDGSRPLGHERGGRDAAARVVGALAQLGHAQEHAAGERALLRRQRVDERVGGPRDRGRDAAAAPVGVDGQSPAVAELPGRAQRVGEHRQRAGLVRDVAHDQLVSRARAGRSMVESADRTGRSRAKGVTMGTKRIRRTTIAALVVAAATAAPAAGMPIDPLGSSSASASRRRRRRRSRRRRRRSTARSARRPRRRCATRKRKRKRPRPPPRPRR